MLRITLSGGRTATSGSFVWMRTHALPEFVTRTDPGAVVELGSPWLAQSDPLARHKSLNYWSRKNASDFARARGFDEVLSTSPLSSDVAVWEGSRTNVFTVDEDATLRTPSTRGPLVPGVMRGLVIERAAELGLRVLEESHLTQAGLTSAVEVFLTNSVRGIVPVGRLHYASDGRVREWNTPSSWTQKLSSAVNDWLQKQGDARS
jgi:branched-subunit amino acid aminotransferase/4-amino-4-deoxychorismate lyase